MDEGDTGGEPPDGEWFTVAAAARRLGITPRSIRGRISRGTLTWRPAGNTGKLVLLSPQDGPAAEPGEPPGGDVLEVVLLREELTEALVRAARAEERAAALRELVDELRAELAAARRPFWRRWFG